MILLGLGPATNLAQAVQRFPEEMATIKILMMANLPVPKMRGAIQGAGFNAYADPHAIDVLLKHTCDFTILGPGAIDEITVDNVDFMGKIAKKPMRSISLFSPSSNPIFMRKAWDKDNASLFMIWFWLLLQRKKTL